MPPANAPKIYLAGPLGFTTAGREYHENVVVKRVRDAGYEVLDPWALPADLAAAMESQQGAALRKTNDAVGGRNAALIDDADALLAILDGSDVDSGTAAEIGYAAAAKKPIVGLRTDIRVTGDNAETIVNLQVEWFIRHSGGEVLKGGLDDAMAALERVTGRAR